MNGKIALEEHMAISDTLSDSAAFAPTECWSELRGRLLDIHGLRLRLMDDHGIEMMILSLNAPAVQAIPDAKQAYDVARRANDFLAEQIERRPGRFQAFAALPMQDPDMAVTELQRCMRDLGFRGALVNGFSQSSDADAAVYYDLPQYLIFWEAVEQLGAPFYLHPRNPLPRWAQVYEGHPWLLGPTWAFGQETAVHALRLIGSGLFDRYPNIRVILGHMGEGLPFNMWRIDNHNAWMHAPPKHKAERRIAYYFSHNFYITTSGNFSDTALLAAILEIGADRILFSTDWPFENIDHAATWFDRATISENDRLKIGRSNAARLFRLSLRS